MYCTISWITYILIVMTCKCTCHLFAYIHTCTCTEVLEHISDIQIMKCTVSENVLHVLANELQKLEK